MLSLVTLKHNPEIKELGQHLLLVSKSRMLVVMPLCEINPRNFRDAEIKRSLQSIRG